MVTDSTKVPLLSRLCGVNDDSGELRVVTIGQPLLKGSKVPIRVRVEPVATLGDRAIGPHLGKIQRYRTAPRSTTSAGREA